MPVLNWTEQEQNEVLDFYGLDGLEPEVWVEYADSKSPLSEPEEENEVMMMRDGLGVQSTSMQLGGAVGGKVEGSLNIDSPNFHTRHFIRQVHRDTTFEELLKGVENLKLSLADHNDCLKNLVKNNFDRLVNAKNSIDTVYADMKAKGLVSADKGLGEASVALSNAFMKAQEIFHPLLARRGQEELITKRLQIYEKYSFIFSLCGKFERYIQLGEYQQAAYDYRKAKGLLAEVNQKSALRKVLEKTWNGHLAKVIAEMRSELFKKLANPVFSYDIHVKMIEYLTELDAHPDPIGFYLAHRKEALLEQISLSKDHALQDLTKVTSDIDLDQTMTRLMQMSKVHDYEGIKKSNLSVCQAWRIREVFFSNISEIFGSFAPSFSKFISDLFGAKIVIGNSHGGGDQMSVYISRLKTFADDIAKIIVESSREILVVSPSESVQERACVTAVFSKRIVASIHLLFIIGEEASMSDIFMERLRTVVLDLTSHMLDILWKHAVNDTQQLAQNESWSLAGLEGFEFSTALLRSFESLIIQVIQTTASMFKAFKDRFKETFEFPPIINQVPEFLGEAICSFLTNLRSLAESSEKQQFDSSSTLESTTLNIGRMGEGYRLLTILTNTLYLQQYTIPQIANIFNDSGLPKLDDAILGNISTALTQVDNVTGRLYLGKRQLGLIRIVDESFDAFDWETPYSGHGIRPFPDRILAELVAIQTEIGDVSPVILRPLMTELVLDIFQAYLGNFKKLTAMSPHGYFQARLEVDYLARKLVTVIDKQAESFIVAIRNVLDTLAHSSQLGTQEDVNQVLDSKLSIMEHQSSLTYACFQYT